VWCFPPEHQGWLANPGGEKLAREASWIHVGKFAKQCGRKGLEEEKCPWFPEWAGLTLLLPAEREAVAGGARPTEGGRGAR
jgi:hypothetical protein